MKLKQRPEDFYVEERTQVVPGPEGPFALYKLDKKGWTTFDALAAIRRRWQLDARRVSYGGLKDRHAHTIQHITVFRGPERGLQHHTFQLTYLGRVAEPFTPRDITSNFFRITLRGIDEQNLSPVLTILPGLQAQGVPNYFDDQRFGSLAPGQNFVVREMIKGHHEEALRLALAAPYAHDRQPQKQEKAILLNHWRDWPACKAALPKGHARSLVDYLAHHPEDFRGAVTRLRPDLLSLYLSAYQSYLWNRLLARWLEANCSPSKLVTIPIRMGPLPFHEALQEDTFRLLQSLELPLPSARLKLLPEAPIRTHLDQVLADEGLRVEDLKLKGVRKPFFSKGVRAALSMPKDLTWQHAPDELHARRQKLILSFELARGSYATLLVKRLQTAAKESQGVLDDLEG